MYKVAGLGLVHILYHSEYFNYNDDLIRNGGKKQSMSSSSLSFKLVPCIGGLTESTSRTTVFVVSTRASSKGNTSVENT